MDSHGGPWPLALLALGVVGCAALAVAPVSDAVGAAWYLVLAALGTGMAVAGACRSGPRRRIWVALALGQVLYLVGDGLWTMYEQVLNIAPYPSWADASYLARYLPCVLALCWLVRGRQVGRDRAAFLDAAILTSAFALPATMFFILPIFSRSDTSILSMMIASAYLIGDVFTRGAAATSKHACGSQPVLPQPHRRVGHPPCHGRLLQPARVMGRLHAHLD